MLHFLTINIIDNKNKDRFWNMKSTWKNKDLCIYMYKAYLSNDTQLTYPEKVTVSLVVIAFYVVRCMN